MKQSKINFILQVDDQITEGINRMRRKLWLMNWAGRLFDAACIVYLIALIGLWCFVIAP